MPLLDPAITSVIEPDHIKALINAIKYHPLTGYHAHKTEELVGKILSNTKGLAKRAYNVVKLSEYNAFEGGKSEGKTGFDEKQVQKGMKVEREHSIHKEVQKRIAKDHLTEFPRYYKALEIMEKRLKEGKMPQ
jgi:hypothetical protein